MLTAKDIRELLKENILEVVFQKADGSQRKMFCTLIDDFLPSKGEKIVTQATEPSDEIITVWDLEHDDWRSFKLSKVLSLEAEKVE